MPWDQDDKRRYQRAWAAEKRRQEAQAMYDSGDRSRRVVNMCGRAWCATRPGQKWCAWGQHAVSVCRFGRSARNRDGLQDMCLACHRMAVHSTQAARVARRRVRGG